MAAVERTVCLESFLDFTVNQFRSTQHSDPSLFHMSILCYSIIEQLFSTIVFSKEVLPWLTAAQSLLVGGCETLTAVLGMTSIVSVICHYIGKLFQLFLLSEDYDEDKSIGTVSAILFYILALQTGLTSLTPEKRFVRLCRNFCLLITALLHFFHNIVAPILMSLSAARNPSK